MKKKYNYLDQEWEEWIFGNAHIKDYFIRKFTGLCSSNSPVILDSLLESLMMFVYDEEN